MFKFICNTINAIELVIGKITTIMFAIIGGFLAGGIGMVFLQVWLECERPGSMSGILRDVNKKEEEPSFKETPKKPRIVRTKRTKKGGE